MFSAPRRTLALFRLLLLYGLLCFLVLAMGLEVQKRKEAGWGLNQPVATTAGLQPPFLGINIELDNATPAERRATLTRLRTTGFGWARQRLDWGQIEPLPGQYDWATSDALLRDLAAAGLQPVIVLDGSPAWARAPQDIAPTDNPFAPPADPATFARFAATFAQRYQQQVTYYQIWDEPNIAPHGGNRHIEPIGYAQLLKVAATAIRSADPNAVILTAALAPTRDRGHTAIDELYFLQRLYAAGAAPAFDAVAVQPFGFANTPTDARERIEVLNFQRIKLVRRVMLAAGDGGTPLWAVRFGWNQQPAAPWGTVSAADQLAFTVAALDLGYRQWPWLAAMGWMIDQPARPASDPLWGFALTPALAAGISEWREGIGGRVAESPIPYSPFATLALVGLALLVVLWRAYAAARLLPWAGWATTYGAWPAGWRVGLWAGLLLVYYLATWPPLIGLCWLLAALLLSSQPQLGLGLAAVLLPFPDHHKEIHLIGQTWAIAPTHAALLCLLPNYLSNLFRKIIPLHSWYDGLALAWLFINLLSSVNVWHWPGYGQGFNALALAPLLLYASVRLFITTAAHWHRLVMALGSSGLLVALLGLWAWSQGQGVAVDGVLRLAGPYYSPNQAALYLERALWLVVGLAGIATGWRRWLWWGASLSMASALLLTASRGAWLLALPAGLLLWLWLRPLPTPALVRVSHWGWRGWVGSAVALLGVAGLAILLLGERLSNSTTILSRFQIWRTTLALWQDQLWLGVGPGGFFWRYPAYLTQPSLEPNLYHPHNLWLEFGAIWGMAGLIWLLFWLVGLAGLIPAARRHPVLLGLLVGLVAGLAHAQVDTFAALPDLAGWNWLVLALLVQKERVMPHGHDPS